MTIRPVRPVHPGSVLARAYAALGASAFGRWFVSTVSPIIDPVLLRATRGRLSTVGVYPVMLLTARGARSGNSRTVPLLYFTDGDRVIAMASNYGRPTHPGWYYNVLASDVVRLNIKGCDGYFTAREAVGAERERLWALAKQMARNYGHYEEMASGRRIRVIVFVAANRPLDLVQSSS
jgi:deazaflavin-dependent oxidoreductase (nitroreductase family)